MNDPNTGQFMWGDVIQDMIRNYLMMQMMKDKKQQPDPLSQAATVGPVGGQDSTLQPPGHLGPNPQDSMSMLQNPQFMQMLMQLLQQSQMGR